MHRSNKHAGIGFHGYQPLLLPAPPPPIWELWIKVLESGILRDTSEYSMVASGRLSPQLCLGPPSSGCSLVSQATLEALPVPPPQSGLASVTWNITIT